MKIFALALTLLLSLHGVSEAKQAEIEKNKATAKGEAPDPNNFLKDRDWKWEIKDYGTVVGTSRYTGEPISKPNLLKLNVVCPGEEGKKYYPIVDGFKYCGITSISPSGKILVVHFMDWDDNNPNSCTVKRVEKVELPDVCGNSKGKTAKKKSKKTKRMPASK